MVPATYALKAAAVVATPPSSGSASVTTDVTLTTATKDGTIHYTTDGSVPTCTTGTTAMNTATFTVSGATTVRAMACKADFVARTVVAPLTVNVAVFVAVVPVVPVGTDPSVV